MTLRQAQGRPRHKPRPTHAALIAQGRAAERADVLAQLGLSRDGARAMAAKHGGADVESDVDLMLYLNRLDALIGTIAGGLHEGLAS